MISARDLPTSRGAEVWGTRGSGGPAPDIPREVLARRELARRRRLGNITLAISQGGRAPSWCPTLTRGEWDLCCSFYKFDMVGSHSCFGDYPTWNFFMCCGARLGRSKVRRLWRDNFTSSWLPRPAPDLRDQQPLLGPVTFIVQFKTGHHILQNWLDNPGMLRSSLRLEVENLSAGSAYHSQTRATMPPFYQGWLRTFRPRGSVSGHGQSQQGGRPSTLDEDGKRLLDEEAVKDVMSRSVHFYASPPYWWQVSERVYRHRMVHFVRRPSDIVASAHVYLLSPGEQEQWVNHVDPPSCMNCDLAAWLEIFSICRFQCSFGQLLERSSPAKALEMQVLRSRWQLLRMLSTMHIWQVDSRMLPLSLDSLDSNFDQTLECIIRFTLDTPGDDELPRRLHIKRLMAFAKRLSPKVLRRRCLGRLGECTSIEGNATLHMSPLDKRQRVREQLSRLARDGSGWASLLPQADVVWETLLARSPVPEAFGCPKT